MMCTLMLITSGSGHVASAHMHLLRELVPAALVLLQLQSGRSGDLPASCKVLDRLLSQMAGKGRQDPPEHLTHSTDVMPYQSLLEDCSKR